MQWLNGAQCMPCYQNEMEIIRPSKISTRTFLLKMALPIIFASGPYQSEVNLC